MFRFIIIFSFLKLLLLFLIWIYQKIISKFLLPRCRFYPSCSEYAKKSLEKHKIHFAIWLICKRLVKCHPGCSGGLDPVPECIKDKIKTKSKSIQ
jgi:uncharacterized protein